MIKLQVYLDGYNNIKTAEKLCGGYCYGHIKDENGNFLGQIEIVIPFGEQGFIAAKDNAGLISIIDVNQTNFWNLMSRLKKLGFSGLVTVSHDESYTDEKWYRDEKSVYGALYI